MVTGAVAGPLTIVGSTVMSLGVWPLTLPPARTSTSSAMQMV